MKRRISKRRPLRENKKELKRRNIVGEEDAETITATPSATPTGTEQVQTAANGAALPQRKEEEEPDPMVDYIVQQLKQRGEKLTQQNQQEFLVRKNEYDKFMKEIEDYISKNKGK